MGQFDRQIVKWGEENQRRLEKSRVLIIGDNYTSYFSSVALAGLGVSNLGVMGKNVCFGSELREINGQMNVDVFDCVYSNGIINAYRPDVVVYCGGELKGEVTRFADLQGIDLICSVDGNIVSSGINGAVIADEVRKRRFNVDERDCLLDGDVLFDYGLDGDYSDKNVLVIGAGAVGNFVCMHLALLGVDNVDVYDHDYIEITNLNRQPLFRQSVGQNKAEVIAKRMEEIGCSNVNGFVEKVGEEHESEFEKYDVVFCCVDKFYSRKLINDFCVKYGVPLVYGATEAMTGSCLVYSPGDKCISCMVDLDALIEVERTREVSSSCVDKAESSVIIPNMVVGSLMVVEMQNICGSKMIHFSSYSSDRIREEDVLFVNKCGCRYG